MTTRTNTYCDECDKIIKAETGFNVSGRIIPLGFDDEDHYHQQEHVVKDGDYCPSCLGKKLGLQPDVLTEIMSGLEEFFPNTGQKPEKQSVNICDVLSQSLDDLCEMFEPSEATKQRVKDLGVRVQTNWSEFSTDLQVKLKKVFNVDDSNPDNPQVTPKNGSSNGVQNN